LVGLNVRCALADGHTKTIITLGLH